MRNLREIKFFNRIIANYRYPFDEQGKGQGTLFMKFRPCIDIHNGKVKQIVGGSLKDQETRQMKILFRSRMRLTMRSYIKKKGSPEVM